MFDHCSVRDVAVNDLPLLLAWRNHPSIKMFMFNQHEISLVEHRAWFDKVSTDPRRRLLIVMEDQSPFGYVQFSNVEENGIADWGFYVKPGLSRGYGKKLAIAALNFAFNDLKLHKVCGQVIDINEISISFHRRMGFTEEGLLRDQQRVNDVYHTLFCFGLLSNEWNPIQFTLKDNNAKI